MFRKMALGLTFSALGISSGARADDDYAIDTLSVTLPSGDAADVYFPAVVSTPCHSFEDAFPLIAFLPGALTDKSYYSAFASELAAHGYVVYVPNHFKQFGPAPLLFADGNSVNDVLASATMFDGDATSPLYRIVDTQAMGVSGHSFGGVAAVFSATASCQPPFCIPPTPVYARPAALKAAAVYGVHTVQNDVAGDVANDLPTALLGGSEDTKAVPEEIDATYSVLEPTRAQIMLEGVNHWGIADLQNPPGTQPEPEAQTRSQSWSIAKIAKWTAVFFDAYVRGERGAQRRIEGARSERGVTITSDVQ